MALTERVSEIEKDLRDVCKKSADFIEASDEKIEMLRRLLRLNMSLTAFLLTRELGTLDVSTVVKAVNSEQERVGRAVIQALIDHEQQEHEASH